MGVVLTGVEERRSLANCFWTPHWIPVEWSQLLVEWSQLLVE